MKLVKSGDVLTAVLVACALLTTALVVRREFVDARPSVPHQAPVFIEKWQEGLERGIRSGRADAPVQLLEFADFECPACARFETTLKLIQERYPEQVALIFAHAPLEFHRFAEPAARAAECAEKQGKFATMRSVLFSRQDAFGLITWDELAIQAGVPDIATFGTCLDDAASHTRVAEGRKLASEFDIQGTPTLIVNGWKLPFPPSVEELDAMVKKVLAGEEPIVKGTQSRWWRPSA